MKEEKKSPDEILKERNNLIGELNLEYDKFLNLLKQYTNEKDEGKNREIRKKILISKKRVDELGKTIYGEVETLTETKNQKPEPLYAFDKDDYLVEICDDLEAQIDRVMTEMFGKGEKRGVGMSLWGRG